MAGDKIDVSFEINADADKLLEQIADKYDLPDKSKALRYLLDYVDENNLSGMKCLLQIVVTDVDDKI